MKLNVLLVSDQVRGIDGTGGLGDVAAGLAKELAGRGDVDIRLVMPGYLPRSEAERRQRFSEVVMDRMPVRLGAETLHVQVCRVTLPRYNTAEPLVTCYLLCEPTWFDTRENSGAQAVLLARATLAFVQEFSEFRPDLIHCNDWHTALIPVYLNTTFRHDPHLSRIATVYTAHNNSGPAYQGSKDFWEVRNLAELPDECYRPGATRSLEHFGQFNFAKGGFGFADLLNTVSLSYAEELLGPACGGSLEGVLIERAADFCGILNGIDTHEWDPAHDNFLPQACRFSANLPVDEVLASKRLVRAELREWKDKSGQQPFAALRDDSLLVAVITRIAEQKMPLLIPLPEDTGGRQEFASPLGWACLQQETDVQVIFVGNADKSDWRGQQYAERLRHLRQTFSERLMFFDGYDIGLSHLVYAAAELFLVPSIYEPCGLTQLTAMRYGGVPVVRGVGGLRDTVLDEQAGAGANGFVFQELQGEPGQWTQMADVVSGLEQLRKTLQRAFEVSRNPIRWAELVRKGLTRDSSWEIPAGQYRKLYAKAVERRVERFFSKPDTPAALRREWQLAWGKLEQCLTMPAPVFSNLSKFEGRFGMFEMNPGFQQELDFLYGLGLLAGTPPSQLPPRGENLSQFLSLTDAGRDVVRIRRAIRQTIV